MDLEGAWTCTVAEIVGYRKAAPAFQYEPLGGPGDDGCQGKTRHGRLSH